MSIVATRHRKKMASPWRSPHAGREHRIGAKAAGAIGHDLELPAPQASGDLERPSGTPSAFSEAQGRRDLRARAAGRSTGSAARKEPARSQQLAQRMRSRASVLPHRLQLSAAAQGKTATSGPDVETSSPGAVPTGSSTAAPSRHARLLARPPPASPPLPGGLSRERRPQVQRTAQMRLLQVRVEARSTHPAHSATTSRREIVGGRPQAAAGQHQVHADPGEEIQRRAQVVRAVRDNDRVRQHDPVRPQLLREPRAVGVRDDPRQHLGPVTMMPARTLTSRRACRPHGFLEPRRLLARADLVPDRRDPDFRPSGKALAAPHDIRTTAVAEVHAKALASGTNFVALARLEEVRPPNDLLAGTRPPRTRTRARWAVSRSVDSASAPPFFFFLALRGAWVVGVAVAVAVAIWFGASFLGRRGRPARRPSR